MENSLMGEKSRPMTEEEALALKPEEIIPHRGDWLQARRVHGWNPEEGVITVKCPVPMSPGWVDEHYPRNPVMPGNLVNEACAQAVGLLALVTQEDLRSKVALLRGINTTMRAQSVPPGNSLYVEASDLVIRKGSSFAKANVRAYLNVVREDMLVCDGEITLALVDPPAS